MSDEQDSLIPELVEMAGRSMRLDTTTAAWDYVHAAGKLMKRAVDALAGKGEALITTETSLRFNLASAKERIRDLEDDVRVLRGRLAESDAK